MCQSLITIKNPSGRESPFISVPCGRCMACKKNKRTEWAIRLENQLKDTPVAYFVTLTYAPVKVPTNVDETTGEIYESLRKEDIQLFIKRIRKKINQKMKYFIVGEYGSKTKRPHYHCLFFLEEKYTNRFGADMFGKVLQEKWIDVKNEEPMGFVHIGDVTPKSIRYTTKYCLKLNQSEEHLKTWTLSSQGLGNRYIEKHKDWHKADIRRNYHIGVDGNRSRLPRYYREKIYTDRERKRQSENGRCEIEQKKAVEERKRGGTDVNIYQKYEYEKMIINKRNKEKL